MSREKMVNEMTGHELLEDAIQTCETCEADPCTNCGACEQYIVEGYGI